MFDVSGNVLDWCADWYLNDYYQTFKSSKVVNPLGPTDSYDPDEPYTSKKVARGGSFMGNDSYCFGFRVARRIKAVKILA